MGPWRDREPLVHWCHGATGGRSCNDLRMPGSSARQWHHAYPTFSGSPPIPAAPTPTHSVFPAPVLLLTSARPAGAVFLFCKAHEQLGDPAYLAAAQRSGEAVWQRGLLKKVGGRAQGLQRAAEIRRASCDGLLPDSFVASRTQDYTAAVAVLLCSSHAPPTRICAMPQGPGACHGVSGSAYALLRLYRSCPPGPARDKWLHRARQFALFMDG